MYRPEKTQVFVFMTLAVIMNWIAANSLLCEQSFPHNMKRKSLNWETGKVELDSAQVSSGLTYSMGNIENGIQTTME